MLDNYVDIRLKLHVNIIILHVDINKRHVNMIMLHVDIMYVACMGQRCSIIKMNTVNILCVIFQLLKIYQCRMVILSPPDNSNHS